MEKTKEEKIQEYKDSLIKTSKRTNQKIINEEEITAFRALLQEKARELYDYKQLVKELEEDYNELTVEFIDTYISEWGLELPKDYK